MLIANIVVLLIILASAAYQYVKGTLVKAFATIITTVCAGVVAFGYFELVAQIFISRNLVAAWAQLISFGLLFFLAFAVFQTLVSQLTRQPIDLGLWPERIGRIVCGIFLGLFISGLLLTAVAMAPIPSKWPYQRFDQDRMDVKKPDKVLFNADGFTAGWFSILSRGSFSGKRSFAILHPNYLNQVFLNRLEIAKGISVITSSDAITVPKKKAVWPAPEKLKDSSGKAVSHKRDHSLTILRAGINKRAIKDAGTFTLSQLRLVCKQKIDAKRPLAGKGKNIYPIGYLKTANQLQEKKINDQMKIERGDFEGSVKWIDFAFYVPNDLVPVLVEFKQNSIALVPPPVTAEQAPAVMPFIQLSRCAKDIAQISPVSSAKVYGVELAAGTNLLAGLTLKINDANEWQNAQTTRSIKPAQFDEGKISFVRAELKAKVSAEEEREEEEEEEEPGRESPRRRRFTLEDLAEAEIGTRAMLKPLDGYKLLSLKCNNPSCGNAIKGRQLPVLIEPSGSIHHAVGVIASGKVGDQTIYEVDYCSLTADDITGGLELAEDGSVAQPFPDTVWLTKRVESISEFYVLYLVKSDRNAVITSVRPGDSQIAAGFKEYEGFFIK